MSWFWRGFQSAIFYYVSCAPCSKLAYQRRRRRDNKRAKAQHAASEAEQGLYRVRFFATLYPVSQDQDTCGNNLPENHSLWLNGYPEMELLTLA